LGPFEKTQGDDKALIYLLGTSLIYDGQTLRGQKLVDRIFSQGDSVEGHLILGTAQLLVKDYPAAAKEFEKALQLDPKCPSANGSYGLALKEMSRIDDAAVYFRRELEINPYDFDANLYLGIYLYKTEQKYDEAQALFERALGIRPGSPDARYHLGLVYLLKGDLQRALAILESVVKEVPDYMEGHAALTTLYYRLGRKEDAKRHRAIVERLRAERDAATPKDMAQPGSGSGGSPEAPRR
ncbi:MAG: tetratricopeptide repeat protein, partial [Acidobacteriota bacterium]